MSDHSPNSFTALLLCTCDADGTVALGRLSRGGEKTEFSKEIAFPARTYSAELIPKIGQLLADESIPLSAVDAIAVVSGPGSFTGIRVGLGTAKGLADPTGIPLIALSRLELMAYASGLPHVFAVAGAGRGEFYLGEYLGQRMVREELLEAAQVWLRLDESQKGTLVCERSTAGSISEGSTASIFARLNPVCVPAVHAAMGIRLALQRWQTAKFEDLTTLDGNYLRSSRVELFGSADAKRASRGE